MSHLTLDRIRPGDLEIIVRSHLTYWPNTELSVRLGEETLRRFYEDVLSGPNVATVGARLQGRLVAWSVGFLEYDRFHSAFFFGHLPLLVIAVLRGLFRRTLNPLYLSQLLLAPKPHRNVTSPQTHLGAFGTTDNRPESVLCLVRSVEALTSELLTHSPAVWAVTSADNKVGTFVLERTGYKIVARNNIGQDTRITYERKNSSER